MKCIENKSKQAKQAKVSIKGRDTKETIIFHISWSWRNQRYWRNLETEEKPFVFGFATFDKNIEHVNQFLFYVL